MTKKVYTLNETSALDRRFKILKYKLEYLWLEFPSEGVLYPMMAKPIYEDFEVLLALTIERAEAARATVANDSASQNNT